MVNLLIVDEEQILRSGMPQHIAWRQFGVDMVQCAEHGEEALELCKQFRPDIVLLPERLQGFSDGLMCARIRAVYPDCRILLVSDGGDRESPGADLSLEGVECLANPLSPELFFEAIWNAVRFCEKNRKKYALAEDSRCSRDERTRRRLRALAYGEEGADLSGLFSRQHEAYRFCVLRAAESMQSVYGLQRELESVLGRLPEIQGNGAWVSAFLDDRDFCILLSGEPEAIDKACAFLEALRGRVESLSLPGSRYFMSVGTLVRSPAELYGSFGYIQLSMKELFFEGWGRCAQGDAFRPVLPVRFNPVMIRALVSACSQGDVQAADRMLEEVYRAMAKQTGTDPGEIRTVYCTLAERLHLKFSPETHAGSATEQNSGSVSAAELLFSFETLEELHAYVAEHIHRSMGTEDGEDVHSSAVQEVIRIMRARFSDKDLSVKFLAESVYLTPTYLSSLFKKHIGTTIGQYLTDLRMEHAMKLLLDRQLKLYHVAQMVGYEDPNYFAKIFKRHLGLTPSAFREKKLR